MSANAARSVTEVWLSVSRIICTLNRTKVALHRGMEPTDPPLDSPLLRRTSSLLMTDESEMISLILDNKGHGLFPYRLGRG